MRDQVVEKFLTEVRTVADFKQALSQINLDTFKMILTQAAQLLPDEILQVLIRDTFCRRSSLRLENELQMPDDMWDYSQTYLIQALAHVPSDKPTSVFCTMLQNADPVVVALAAAQSLENIGLLTLHVTHIQEALHKKVCLPGEQKQHELIFYLAYYVPTILDTYIRSHRLFPEVTHTIAKLNHSDTLFGVSKTLLLFRYADIAKSILQQAPKKAIREFIELITALKLNKMAPADSPFAGESVAFWLFRAADAEFLATYNYSLAKHINPATLNCIISKGPYRGESVASQIAETPWGTSLLIAHGGALAKQIDPATLNQIIISGPNIGKSVAFFLSIGRGLALLTANGGALAAQICEATLNSIAQSQHLEGQSIAFNLAATASGRALLAANNGALAALVSAQALNSITLSPHFNGQSTAYYLAATAEGRALLAANDGALAKNISANTLNYKSRNGDSVAFQLARSAQGVACLTADDCSLAKQISPETLNRTLSYGDDAGQSVAFCLVITAQGRELLLANDGALAKLISDHKLNRSAQFGEYAGESILSVLQATAEQGSTILAHIGQRKRPANGATRQPKMPRRHPLQRGAFPMPPDHDSDTSDEDDHVPRLSADFR